MAPKKRAAARPRSRPRSPPSRAAAAPTEHPARSKTAFVTVGTTRFDALVAAVDDPAFETALAARGFTRLVVQAGAYEEASQPRRETHSAKKRGTRAGPAAVAVDRFAYAPSLAAHMDAADLVVSHAGAGSLFEALRRRKPTIAVPNPALMGDHQGELARTLAAGGHVSVAAPTTRALVAAVEAVDLGGGGKGWAPGSPAGIVAALDELAGRAAAAKKLRRRI